MFAIDAFNTDDCVTIESSLATDEFEAYDIRVSPSKSRTSDKARESRFVSGFGMLPTVLSQSKRASFPDADIPSFDATSPNSDELVSLSSALVNFPPPV